MPDGVAEPIGSVQEAHIYGQITLDVVADGRVLASEEQLQELVGFARRRIQNRVVPAVEHLVEEDGARIGGVSHAEKDHDVHLPHAVVSAHADCEMMAGVSQDTKDQVKEVLKRELLEPMDRFFRPKPQRERDTTRKRSVRAARSVLREFRGRGA